MLNFFKDSRPQTKFKGTLVTLVSGALLLGTGNEVLSFPELDKSIQELIKEKEAKGEIEAAPAPIKVEIFKTLHEELLNTVNGLADPVKWENAVRVPIDVTTEDKEARYFTRQGFGLLQGQWDIEAHRSFVYALKQDQHCIGSYIGLLMLSKHRHNPSFYSQKSLQSVVLTLKNKQVDGEYVYTLQERLYAEVALTMVEGIKEDLAASVAELVKSYPMDFQALIMKQVLLPPSAGGKDLQGKTEFVGRLMKNYPLVPMIWVYWLNIHQFNKDQDFLKKEVVPYSTNLVKWAPKMPVWYLFNGMFLYKAGEHDEADKSFDKAVEIYTAWGERSKVPRDVNAPLWQALIFKSVNYYKAGKFDEAMKLAKELQKAQVNVGLRSEVRGIYLWEIQSLPARLYLARNEAGDLNRAKESLPAKKLLDSVQEISAAPMYYSGLYEYIGFKLAIMDGKKEEARRLRDKLAKTNQNFLLTAGKHTNFVDMNYFYRGKNAVAVYYNYVSRNNTFGRFFFSNKAIS